jgi:hypothetical protein
MSGTLRHVLRLLPLLAAVAASAGSSSYSARRAALVPEVAPPMRSGAPMETQGEISLAVPGVARTGEARVSDDSEGIELPGLAITGAGRLNAGKGFDIGLAYEHGTASGSRKLAEDQPDVANGDTYGFGLSWMLARQMPDRRVGLAITGDAMLFSVPYAEQLTSGGSTGTKRERETVPVLGLGVIPSFVIGEHVRLFGGLSVRNQPTTPRGGVEDGIGDDDEVHMGEFVWTASAGAEASFGGLRVLAMVYRPLESGGSIEYPTSVALGVTWAFGKPRVTPATGAPPAPAADERRPDGAVATSR